ncbi:hypothetical protein PoB_006108900 [Plakobranchus ocellatus]|uniref:Uncharacterized protein n=1 Tax=Plakobranchus ocellatus TaxID=259542 RepID=A0AAV4CRT1_9GAST|nr:hypothetical protein PoB_006108900 [Plakobranchus ocellatus]
MPVCGVEDDRAAASKREAAISGCITPVVATQQRRTHLLDARHLPTPHPPSGSLASLWPSLSQLPITPPSRLWPGKINHTVVTTHTRGARLSPSTSSTASSQLPPPPPQRSGPTILSLEVRAKERSTFIIYIPKGKDTLIIKPTLAV